MLKRLYLDRILGRTRYAKLQGLSIKAVPQFVCPECRGHLGVPIIYRKEKRPAYRLFVGSVMKEIVNSGEVRW